MPSAFVINPIWDPSLLASSQAGQVEAAVNLEISRLEATFSNAVTIDLHVGWGETDGYSIGSNALASATFANYDTYSYSQVQAALAGRPYNLPAQDPQLQRPDIDRGSERRGSRTRSPISRWTPTSASATPSAGTTADPRTSPTMPMTSSASPPTKSPTPWATTPRRIRMSPPGYWISSASPAPANSIQSINTVMTISAPTAD